MTTPTFEAGDTSEDTSEADSLSGLQPAPALARHVGAEGNPPEGVSSDVPSAHEPDLILVQLGGLSDEMALRGEPPVMFLALWDAGHPSSEEQFPALVGQLTSLALEANETLRVGDLFWECSRQPVEIELDVEGRPVAFQLSDDPVHDELGAGDA